MLIRDGDNDFLPLFFFADIMVQEYCFATCGTNTFGGGFAGLVIDVSQYDTCALASQNLCIGTT